MRLNRQQQFLKKLESLQLYNQLSVKNIMLLVIAHKTIITFLLKLIQFYLMILTSQNVPIRQFTSLFWGLLTPKFSFSVNFGCLERKNMKLQSAADSMTDVKDVCLPPQSYWVCIGFYSWTLVTYLDKKTLRYWNQLIRFAHENFPSLSLFSW